MNMTFINPIIRCNLIVLLLSSATLADPESVLSSEHAKTLNEFKIGKNFKGFAYSSRVHKDVQTLFIRSMPMVEESERFTGLSIKTDSNGKIQEIEPIFEKTHVNQDVMLWAFDKFYEKRIKFDTLWSIMRAANNKELDNRSLFLFILDTINNSARGNHLLKTTKIKSGDESWMVLKNIFPGLSKEEALSDVLSKITKK